MNNKKQDDPNSKTSLIDRRFFLKASSATAAVIAAGSIIPAVAAENQVPELESDTSKIPTTGDNSKTNKQWKAGWMAF